MLPEILITDDCLNVHIDLSKYQKNLVIVIVGEVISPTLSLSAPVLSEVEVSYEVLIQRLVLLGNDFPLILLLGNLLHCLPHSRVIHLIGQLG